MKLVRGLRSDSLNTQRASIAFGRNLHRSISHDNQRQMSLDELYIFMRAKY